MTQKHDANATPAWEVDDADRLTQPTEQPPAPLPPVPPPVARVVEALLFVGGAPLTAMRACETIRGLSEGQFLQAIDCLNRDYRLQGRPYAILSRNAGYILALRPRFREVVERLHGGQREARLSPAAIDALALVAYRQPVTKQEIDGLRGAESGALLRQLVRRGLVAVIQRADAQQREVSYGTTQRFLDLFHLRSLDDLPQTHDLQRL
jgi:segregation and condensation protein B